MSTDFTIILYDPQHIGDQPKGLGGAGGNTASYAGEQATYEFSCRSVDPGQHAVLTLNTYDVNSGKNVFSINGVQVKGGLLKGQGEAWVTHQLIVTPDSNLKDTGNVLHVEARDNRGGTGNVDDFLLDNVVITFKTRDSVGVQQR